MTMIYLRAYLVAVESTQIYGGPFVPGNSHPLPSPGGRPRR
jgi:hypothetical protein